MSIISSYLKTGKPLPEDYAWLLNPTIDSVKKHIESMQMHVSLEEAQHIQKMLTNPSIDDMADYFFSQFNFMDTVFQEHYPNLTEEEKNQVMVVCLMESPVLLGAAKALLATQWIRLCVEQAEKMLESGEKPAENIQYITQQVRLRISKLHLRNPMLKRKKEVSIKEKGITTGKTETKIVQEVSGIKKRCIFCHKI